MRQSSYAEIQKQIAALEAQASRVREQEKAGVLARIREAVVTYGITAAELFGSARAGTPPVGVKSKGAKYSDGNGNSWSGRGPRPKWLRAALESGRSIDEFRSGRSERSKVANAATTSGKASKTARGRKLAKVAVKYRDAAGNTWTGRGSQPRWLRAALEGGKKLADFTV